MQALNGAARRGQRKTIDSQLKEEEIERLSHIEVELSNGYQLAQKYNDTVTFFGSARFGPGHPYYQKAEHIAKVLSRQGYTIVTGGGPGIMEAANKGAFEAGCPSIGLGIELPHEQGMNQYVTDGLSFRYFFSRKVILAFGANGYLFFPGGFGTLDELFEMITLVQTNKMAKVPIILVGVEFWRTMDAFIQLHLLNGEQTISPGDEKLYTVTDDVDLISSLLNQHRDQHTAFSPLTTA
jgi:uncharacterized protein (TIGR00730 family)